MKHSIGFIFFASCIYLLLCGCRSAAEHQLVSAVEDYNSGCPVRMSDLVRIDSLHYERSSRDVTFCCSLIGLSRSVMFDDGDLQTVKDYCERESKAQVERLQSNDYGRETLMLLKQAKSSLSFVYRLECGDTVYYNKFDQ